MYEVVSDLFPSDTNPFALFSVGQCQLAALGEICRGIERMYLERLEGGASHDLPARGSSCK